MTATATWFGLSRIHQIALVSHDIPRSVAFYRDVLGMKLLFEFPPTLALFDCDGVRLMLSLPSEPKYDHPGSLLYYHVPGRQPAVRELQARGLVCEHEPRVLGQLPAADVWGAFFRDPDDNVLALMSEVPR